MNHQDVLKQLLHDLHSHTVSVDEAWSRLRTLPYESLGYAHIDHHRPLRCGIPETIYCPGKTDEQIIAIFQRLALKGNNVLATRASQATYDALVQVIPAAQYETVARAIVLRQEKSAAPLGHIAVVTAGTGDIPVAEEAAVTAELLHVKVERLYDVGVAGLHRLLHHLPVLQQVRAIVVAAGMEGALASVVGGLVAVPVIAVPTSIGYGASFHGIAALLGMLNSCAAGVSVVNIDNGFSAGCIAAMIAKMAHCGT